MNRHGLFTNSPIKLSGQPGRQHKSQDDCLGFLLAPRVRLELTTLRLTAECSAIELPSTGGKRPASGRFGAAESDPEVGAFTECASDSVARDNEYEWADEGTKWQMEKLHDVGAPAENPITFATGFFVPRPSAEKPASRREAPEGSECPVDTTAQP